MQSNSLIMFESLKQINGAFSSRANQTLTKILETFMCLESNQKTELFPIMQNFFVLIGNYSDSENMQALWNVLFLALSNSTDYYLIELAYVWISMDNGSKIPGYI